MRTVIASKERFVEFYRKEDIKTQRKIEYVLDLIRFEEKIREKFFKYLKNTSGIYEVRVVTTFKSIRILCFQDEGRLVVLTNCFIKNHKKTRRPK